jgi:hypothetical protein
MGVFGRALAQDNPGGSEQMEAENARRASDQAIVKFNIDIDDFPSWELFEAVLLAQVTPGLLGTCYTYQGGRCTSPWTHCPGQKRRLDGRRRLAKDGSRRTKIARLSSIGTTKKQGSYYG